jgi:hypothetical protein
MSRKKKGRRAGRSQHGNSAQGGNAEGQIMDTSKVDEAQDYYDMLRQRKRRWSSEDEASQAEYEKLLDEIERAKAALNEAKNEYRATALSPSVTGSEKAVTRRSRAVTRRPGGAVTSAGNVLPFPLLHVPPLEVSRESLRSGGRGGAGRRSGSY